MCFKVIKTIAVRIVSSSEGGSSPVSEHFHVRQFCCSIDSSNSSVASECQQSDRSSMLEGKRRQQATAADADSNPDRVREVSGSTTSDSIERRWATIEPVSRSFRCERLAREVFQATRAALIDRRDANVCRIENAKAEAGRKALPSITAALSWKRSDLLSEVD
jgi:hypothetical protein